MDSLQSTGVLFALSVAPGLLLLWLFFRADRYDPEPASAIWATFFIGAASVIPAGIAEVIIKSVMGGLGFSRGVGTILYFIFGVALVEETAKYLSVRIRALNSSAFNEVMDGVVYCVAAGAGFATLENVLYVFRYGVGAGVVRAVLSVPSHVFWAAIMGYYVGLAKYSRDGKTSIFLTGLAIATLLHAAFDLFLVSNNIVLIPLVVPLVLIGFFVVRRHVAHALMMSQSGAKGVRFSSLFVPQKPSTPRARHQLLRFAASQLFVFSGAMAAVAFAIIFHENWDTQIGISILLYLSLLPAVPAAVLMFLSRRTEKAVSGA